jgi:hypothetical protein
MFSHAQTADEKLKEIEQLVQKEGDLFLAIDRKNPQDGKVCLEENTYQNTVLFTGHQAQVSFINYTELFCEVYVMRSQFIYQFDLKDVDPATIRLVEKKYNLGNGSLKEGTPGWFEVQLFTHNQQKTITRRDVESKQSDYLSTVSIMVKEKETAKKVIALLKSSLQAIPNLN